MASLNGAPAERWVTLAKVLRPQGRQGEVLAELHTDFPSGLVERRHLYLAPSSSEKFDSTWSPCAITSCWLPKGRNEGKLVLGIAGISTISDAEKLAGLELRTPLEQRTALPADESYVDDLLNCKVLDQGVVIGYVTDVQFPATPDGRRRLEDAPILLVVTGDNGTWMVPFVQAFIDAVDPSAKQIRMSLPAGLLEAQQ